MSANLAIFAALNAPSEPSMLMVGFAKAVAQSPMLVAPALVVALWIWGKPEARAGLLATAAAVFVGQGANLVMGLAFFDPRPFMVPIGHTLLAHAADNGFPSDHATLVWTLGMSLLFTGAARRWGGVVMAYGVVVAWTRIWLGVHFPVDMLGSAVVAFIVGLTSGFATPLFGGLERLVSKWYGYCVEAMRARSKIG